MIVASELRAGDQFVDHGRVQYTLISEIAAPFDDEVAFRIRPPQENGVSTKVWKRTTETMLVRP